MRDREIASEKTPGTFAFSESLIVMKPGWLNVWPADERTIANGKSLFTCLLDFLTLASVVLALWIEAVYSLGDGFL